MSRSRLFGVILAALLLGAGLGLTTASAQPPGPIVNSPEGEPNDELWMANHTELGTLMHGTIGQPGDVDFYRYYAQGPGLPLRVTVYLPASSLLAPKVSLYHWEGHLLAEATCAGSGVCLDYTTLDQGDIIARIEDANGNGGGRFTYRFNVAAVDAYEPNDFLDEAAPIAYGESVWGVIEPLGDLDIFRFEGKAGHEIRINLTNGQGQLLDATGAFVTPTDQGSYVLPETGTYYAEVYSCPNYCVYQLSISLIEHPVYVSLNSGGVVDGVAFTSGDILKYSDVRDTWEMYFDASDVGLKGDLEAFTFHTDVLYMVYGKSQTIPNEGKVTAQDMIFAAALVPGEDTSAMLGWLFDGSDVGLTTAAEAIDALALDESINNFLISTKGAARVPAYEGPTTATKNDVLAFYMYAWGSFTSGTWYLDRYIPALDVGAANLIGLDWAGNESLLVSFDRPVVLDGVPLATGDIARCQLLWYQAGCGSVEKVFDAGDARLTGYQVDAFDMTLPGGYP